MNKPMPSKGLPILAALLFLTPCHAGDIPFPDALADADIEVETLDSILDDALLIGNGDINGLVSTSRGTLQIMLTKNDIWDARLDTSNDPPLPTLDRVRELGATGKPIGGVILPEGEEWTGPDSYHSKPYPCPRACARIAFGEAREGPEWVRIRGEGRGNKWERRAGAAVMSIDGSPGASNGYSYRPLDASTDEYAKLRVKLSGTDNAQFFIDIIGPNQEQVLHTGWQPTPPEPTEHVWDLAPGLQAAQLIIYTWTIDGAYAENRFESVELLADGDTLPIDLSLPEYEHTEARLDLTRATATVNGSRDIPPAIIRALADRNVVLIETEAELRLVPTVSLDTPPAELGRAGRVEWLRQEMPGDLDWPGMSFAVALAEGGGAKAVAVVTSHEANDVVRRAVVLARNTLRDSRENSVAAHDALWCDFWSRSGLRMDDEVLERTWYRSLYFLRCVTKPGVVPPGLFMSLTTDTPAWHGDYHTNYNVQQAFWAAYPTNHPELAEPYDRLIVDYLPRARWLAREVCGTGGAFYPHVLFAFEPADPENSNYPIGRQYIHHVWGMTLGVPGFTVQPLWWHYKYAPDREFLAKTAYPAVRDVALFQAEFMDQCEGDKHVVLAPSVSPEHWGWTKDFERNRNGTFRIVRMFGVMSSPCVPSPRDKARVSNPSS